MGTHERYNFIIRRCYLDVNAVFPLIIHGSNNYRNFIIISFPEVG